MPYATLWGIPLPLRNIDGFNRWVIKGFRPCVWWSFAIWRRRCALSSKILKKFDNIVIFRRLPCYVTWWMTMYFWCSTLGGSDSKTIDLYGERENSWREKRGRRRQLFLLVWSRSTCADLSTNCPLEPVRSTYMTFPWEILFSKNCNLWNPSLAMITVRYCFSGRMTFFS